MDYAFRFIKYTLKTTENNTPKTEFVVQLKDINND